MNDTHEKKPTRGLCLVLALFALGATVGLVAFVTWVALLPAEHNHSPEMNALGALKTITVCESIFREGDKDQNGAFDYGSLAQLSQVELVDAVLGSGTKQGYLFRVEASASTSEFLWFATANPIVPGRTGDWYFCTNQAGVIFYTTTGAFSMNSTDCSIPKNARSVGK
jgi:hypothetical protein